MQKWRECLHQMQPWRRQWCKCSIYMSWIVWSRNSFSLVMADFPGPICLSVFLFYTCMGNCCMTYRCIKYTLFRSVASVFCLILFPFKRNVNDFQNEIFPKIIVKHCPEILPNSLYCASVNYQHHSKIASAFKGHSNLLSFTLKVKSQMFTDDITAVSSGMWQGRSCVFTSLLAPVDW